jgi:hypothetical protein
VLDLEADIVAVDRAVAASTKEEWNPGASATENFEGYADTAALAAVWSETDAANICTMSLGTDSVHEGTKSIKLALSNFTGDWQTCSVERVFSGLPPLAPVRVRVYGRQSVNSFGFPYLMANGGEVFMSLPTNGTWGQSAELVASTDEDGVLAVRLELRDLGTALTVNYWFDLLTITGGGVNVEVDSRGTVRLDDIAGGTSLFSQTAAVGVNHSLGSPDDGDEEYTLNFFPDPSVVGGAPFELLSLTVHLGTFYGVPLVPAFAGTFVVTVGLYDEAWRPVKLGTDILIPASSVPRSGGLVTIDLTQGGERFLFEPGLIDTRTGPGRTAAGAVRSANVDAQGVSHLRVYRGFWISITPHGQLGGQAFIGLTANATLAQFDVNAMWRVAVDRTTGPYPPERPAFPPADVEHNPDDHLITGAVPGFGAKTHANGYWGVARRVTHAQSRQASDGAAFTWEAPYFDLKVRTYPTSGSIVRVLNLGATPTNPVEARFDDSRPRGTSIAYALRGSNTSASGPWTTIGAVEDGDELTGANLFQWYELTATLTAGPVGGATRFTTPSLQAWMLTERRRYSTHRYLRTLDAPSEIDPTNGKSTIAEVPVALDRRGSVAWREGASP